MKITIFLKVYKQILNEGRTSSWKYNEHRDVKNVAIACAVTSKGMESVEFSNHPIMEVFLPTFCATASEGFAYSFYLRLVLQKILVWNTNFLCLL